MIIVLLVMFSRSRWSCSFRSPFTSLGLKCRSPLLVTFDLESTPFFTIIASKISLCSLFSNLSGSNLVFRGEATPCRLLKSTLLVASFVGFFVVDGIDFNVLTAVASLRNNLDPLKGGIYRFGFRICLESSFLSPDFISISVSGFHVHFGKRELQLGLAVSSRALTFPFSVSFHSSLFSESYSLPSEML